MYTGWRRSSHARGATVSDVRNRRGLRRITPTRLVSALAGVISVGVRVVVRARADLCARSPHVVRQITRFCSPLCMGIVTDTWMPGSKARNESTKRAAQRFWATFRAAGKIFTTKTLTFSRHDWTRRVCSASRPMERANLSEAGKSKIRVVFDFSKPKELQPHCHLGGNRRDGISMG